MNFLKDGYNRRDLIGLNTNHDRVEINTACRSDNAWLELHATCLYFVTYVPKST